MQGFLRAKIGDYWIYSCYLAPSLSLPRFEHTLDRIARDASGRQNIVIAGDFNAWSVEWGCPSTNARGRAILEAFAALNIVLLNTGTSNTFSRGGIGSIIDLAFTSSALAMQAKWSLSEVYTASDHLAIVIDIGYMQHTRTHHHPQIGYKADSLRRNEFEAAFNPPRISCDAKFGN